jgi:hypothetical protein
LYLNAASMIPAMGSAMCEKCVEIDGKVVAATPTTSPTPDTFPSNRETGGARARWFDKILPVFGTEIPSISNGYDEQLSVSVVAPVDLNR